MDAEMTVELTRLLQSWRQFVAKMDAPDDFSRESGYAAGLTVCARQLEETIARLRDDIPVSAQA